MTMRFCCEIHETPESREQTPRCHHREGRRPCGREPVQRKIDRLASIVAAAAPATAAWPRMTPSRAPASPLGPPQPMAPKRRSRRREAILPGPRPRRRHRTGRRRNRRDGNMQAEARVAAEGAAPPTRRSGSPLNSFCVDEANQLSRRSPRPSPPRTPRRDELMLPGKAILSEFAATTKHTEKFSLRLGAFDRDRRTPRSIPHTPDANEFLGEWRALAAGLLQSAEAAIGDAPITPLPAHPMRRNARSRGGRRGRRSRVPDHKRQEVI